MELLLGLALLLLIWRYLGSLPIPLIWKLVLAVVGGLFLYSVLFGILQWAMSLFTTWPVLGVLAVVVVVGIGVGGYLLGRRSLSDGNGPPPIW